MKLKSLEIKGFKSFADKTQILLDNPITGIVGPNGCGKSNIIDAIRWVIGEHKIKSLRSDNLDDLVFNGSRSRSPSGMAEVSLTFDNDKNLLPTEFSSVTITRKFYKNGESEYRLNDVACRLKDIHNLFIDTGVSNDSYAIIELGMVDDIIKDKEGSRRRMLEQAAGITIYKQRKKEAKLKLEATEGDLARIEDLLFEIGNNLRSLEAQAKKAEKFFQLKEEYKLTSIELAKASLSEFNELYKSLNQQQSSEGDRKTAFDEALVSETEQLAINKEGMSAVETALHAVRKLFFDLQNQIRTLENNKNLSAQKLEHLRERATQLESFIEQAVSQIESAHNQLEDAQALLSDEIDSLEDAKELIESFTDSVLDKKEALDEHKSKVEDLKLKLQDHQRLQFEKEKTVAVADTSIMSLQRNIQQIHEEENHRSSEINNLKINKSNAENELNLLKDDYTDILEKHDDLKASIDANQKELQEVTTIFQGQNRSLDAKRNEHDLLKSLLESLEGYPDSIKHLKNNEKWPSEGPLLSDAFVVNPNYRFAIEQILDPFLNYYVVKDIAAAKEAINLLQQDQKGKANFFILDQLNKVAFTGAKYVPAEDKGLVPALDTVTFEPMFKDLATHLLSNVFIATQAITDVTALQLPAHAVVIKQDGSIMKGTFTIGGGSLGTFEGNKIGRAKNLERLSLEIENLTLSTEHLDETMLGLKANIEHFSSQLDEKLVDELKIEINKTENEIVIFNNKIEHFEQVKEKSQAHLTELTEQLNDHLDIVQDDKEALVELNEQLQSVLSEIKLAEQGFQSMEIDYNMAIQQQNNHHITLAKQQSKIDNAKQQIAYLENQIRDTEAQIASNTSELNAKLEILNATSGDLNVGDEALNALMEEKALQNLNLEAAQQTYEELKNKIADQEINLNNLRKERENADVLLGAIKDKLGEMRLQLAGLKERLEVEFKVDIDLVLNEDRVLELPVEELKVEADKLKKRIANIGEVNPTAIEAYQEIKIRYDFIDEQKCDLEEARDTLMSTIKEVEDTANRKFKDTFDKVRANFVQVFKALFTEDDKADLRLTDPNNIAESGIEIYAQPKGKRPSTLTQLSGGEKTLTSTAFLFAIYLIKPAPFCILDEVDAPLDDANVMKFTQMIRKFSDNSQFIIVTHNKQTMASVDVIYGVTMQEAGVSKLVPVDFRSLN